MLFYMPLGFSLILYFEYGISQYSSLRRRLLSLRCLVSPFIQFILFTIFSYVVRINLYVSWFRDIRRSRDRNSFHPVLRFRFSFSLSVLCEVLGLVCCFGEEMMKSLVDNFLIFLYKVHVFVRLSNQILSGLYDTVGLAADTWITRIKLWVSEFWEYLKRIFRRQSSVENLTTLAGAVLLLEIPLVLDAPWFPHDDNTSTARKPQTLECFK